MENSRVHYKIEYVGIFSGSDPWRYSFRSSIPYLTDNLGLPYELAWSCVIIEVFMYMLHGWLGDPVVPGWITPTLPFTLAYLNGFEKGPERIQAMIALQLLVAFVFIFMGNHKLANKFVNGIAEFYQRWYSDRSPDHSIARDSCLTEVS